MIEHADPPHHADRDRAEIRGLQQAAADQGYRGDFLRKHGAADGRFYYQRGTDAVIFGIGGDGLHGPDEYADTTTIGPYYSGAHGVPPPSPAALSCCRFQSAVSITRREA